MKKIIFITSQNLSEWNYKRFGLEVLSKSFKVEYWNVANLHSENSLDEKNYVYTKNVNIINFRGYLDLLKKCYNQNKNVFLINQSSNQDLSFIISKNLMIIKGVKEIFLVTGAYVETPMEIKNKFKTFFKKLKYKHYFSYFLKSKLLKLKNLLIIKKYYHYFINSNFNNISNKKKNFTYSHAIDYNLFLELKNLNINNKKNILHI